MGQDVSRGVREGLNELNRDKASLSCIDFNNRVKMCFCDIPIIHIVCRIKKKKDSLINMSGRMFDSFLCNIHYVGQKAGWIKHIQINRNKPTHLHRQDVSDVLRVVSNIYLYEYPFLSD